MRIVFMGTPDFAVASLDRLVKNQKDIVAVVTSPDKPAGRGQKLNESAVKKYAVENKLLVLQPEKLKDPAFIETLQHLNADLFIVVAFRMLPEMVWTMPKLGTFNLHGSLLPQYRGAAPINWAILNGEKESGVTTFFLKHEIDTGSIIHQAKTAINEQMNAGELHDTLMEIGADLVLQTVNEIEQNNVHPISQEETMKRNSLKESDLKHAPKIFKEDMKINWDRTAKEVYQHIKGLSPYPTAFTQLNQLGLKIYDAEISENLLLTPGEYQTDGKTFLKFQCKVGSISITDLQLEGKKRMKVEEFLRGNRLV
ncbi:MAG: methionyl-tRNA formyltransferase [Sphingobacteriales bacterium]|nr:methionyl-tRNA formyltransferase [Sphingobacteriales bacterium]